MMADDEGEAPINLENSVLSDLRPELMCPRQMPSI